MQLRKVHLMNIYRLTRVDNQRFYLVARNVDAASDLCNKIFGFYPMTIEPRVNSKWELV